MRIDVNNGGVTGVTVQAGLTLGTVTQTIAKIKHKIFILSLLLLVSSDFSLYCLLLVFQENSLIYTIRSAIKAICLYSQKQ